ncbi:zf-HC2 domain-containing protein [Paenibacillus glycanilyticus]|uniref:anti-sigma factor family protein n=1 Tax=Paenibacillus glycanilyticus TaxID=126569 RepID=UPI0020419408|nr:zf-HC2 domain-containing protein [Paenibacillus glycanilyticus]MCM3627242.1 zf-HC2 domain-containing protein [Paenibacillus glycanilyticus]
MTCQEVIEYMNRQLDDDLGEHEYEILMKHTRHCPDCAAMFERLKKLSEELGNLPHVMPKYSLVDAILPQLEQVVPFRQPEAASVEMSPAAAPAPQQARRAKERHQLRFRAITGIIAASVAAGLFLVSYNAGLFPSSNSFGDDNKSNSVAAADVQSDTFAAAKQFSNDGNKAEVGTESIEQDGSNETMRSAGNDDHVTTEEDLGISGMESGNSAGGSDGPASGDNSGSVPGEAPSIAGPNQGGGESFSDPNEGLVPAPLQAVSSDGSYIAKAAGYVIHVYNAGDNSDVYTSKRRNGKISTLLWSDDSKQLTYEIQLESGGMERYVIDMATLTESKAAH